MELKAKNGKLCNVLSLQRVASGVGVKKPGDSQKAKDLWTMKATSDRDDEFYDPNQSSGRHSRKTSNTIGIVGRTPLKSGGSAGEGVRMS